MTFAYFLNVFLMLALVAGMAVGTLWLMRRLQPGLGSGGRERAIRVVDAISMGAMGARLVVVEFEGRRLLVGVTRGRMDLIAEGAGDFAPFIDDGA
ncbi:FliO/MopB family protein [Sphingomonas morindae]|uniref:Flagellar biosynthetic protein FliO n=1 Tax=Sphingomonas morindae TaxID=1541170 RepID=A0ABY4XAK3_9SPHN|nr:flagellar biosynthetic protein FliO [Sphingomonas morindae]USI73715.1 flagellar biosynthetic protein FliO [Sphingomonas morindae]